MHTFWNSFLEPLIKAVKPSRVLEIGSEKGVNTNLLASSLCASGVELFIIEPKPEFEPSSLNKKFGANFKFIEKQSSDCLESCLPADLILLNGESNWFFIYTQLEIIGSFCEKQGIEFPVVSVCNTGWPYARRDCYPDQSMVPEKSRQSSRTGGVVPGGKTPLPSVGFNMMAVHAETEGGPRNGVLTAIEDFIDSSTTSLAKLQLEGFHGITLVYPEQLAETNAKLKYFLNSISTSKEINCFIQNLEESRNTARFERDSFEALINEQTEKHDLERDRLQKVTEEIPKHLSKIKSLRNEAAILEGHKNSSNQKLILAEQAIKELEESSALQIEEEREKREKLLSQAKENESNLSACYRRLLSEHQRTLWHSSASIYECLDQALNLLKTVAASKKYKYSTGLINKNSYRHVQNFFRDCEIASGSWRHVLRLPESKHLLKAELSKEAQILEQLQVYHNSLPDLVNFTKMILEQVEIITNSRSYRIGSFVFDSLKGKSLLSKNYPKTLPEFQVAQVRGALAKWENLYTNLPKPPGGLAEFQSGAIQIKLQDNLTVILPVYNAFEDVVRCIESIIKFGGTGFQLLILDDCSPDGRVEPKLRAYAEAHSFIHYFRNKNNQGYTKNINIGCRLAPSDVILLNSDTIVTERWIEKLRAAADSDETIATVTPVSNGAGAFSVPINNQVNKIPVDSSVDEIARQVEELSPLIRPEVPTGNGFCLYIKKSAFSEIGFFDESRFPRGYGEENDFCVRLSKAGYKNIIDDQTYIYHKRSASFGSEKAELIEKSKAIIRELHPDYTTEVRRWLANDPVDVLRERLTGGTSLPVSRNLLYVLHDGGGGTIETSRDLALGLHSSYQPFLLLTGRKHWKLLRRVGKELKLVRLYLFDLEWQVDCPLDFERQKAWKGILDLYNWDTVHFRHFLGNAPELIEDIRARSIPLIVSLHDYYTISPCLQLISREGKYLSKEELESVEPKNQFITANWFKGLDSPERSAYLRLHQERFLPALNYAKMIITTDESPKNIFSDYFPKHISEKIVAIPHGRDLSSKPKLTPSLDNKPWRVLVLGNINISKGQNLFSEMLEENEKKGRPFEFHFLGALTGPMLQIASGHYIHGTYERELLHDRVVEIAPHISLIASVWPETFCHTLTESWSLGLPVLASNLGAPNNRIKAHGGGWLLEPFCGKAWINKLEEIFSNPSDFYEKTKAASNYSSNTVEQMSSSYQAVYDGNYKEVALKIANG